MFLSKELLSKHSLFEVLVCKVAEIEPITSAHLCFLIQNLSQSILNIVVAKLA